MAYVEDWQCRRVGTATSCHHCLSVCVWGAVVRLSAELGAVGTINPSRTKGNLVWFLMLETVSPFWFLAFLKPLWLHTCLSSAWDVPCFLTSILTYLLPLGTWKMIYFVPFSRKPPIAQSLAPGLHSLCACPVTVIANLS